MSPTSKNVGATWLLLLLPVQKYAWARGASTEQAGFDDRGGGTEAFDI